MKKFILTHIRSVFGVSFTAFFTAFLAVSTLTSSTAEAFDFSVLGAASSSSYSITPAPAVFSGGAGFGLGVRLGFDLFPFFSWEVGALYIGYSLSAMTATLNYNYIQIPVLLRFTPIPFVALEAGGYYGIPSSTTSTGAVPPELMNAALPTYSSSNDYGLLIGAGVRLPLLPLMSIRADALYEYGLANVSTGTSTQNARNLDIWAGVMISLL